MAGRPPSQRPLSQPAASLGQDQEPGPGTPSPAVSCPCFPRAGLGCCGMGEIYQQPQPSFSLREQGLYEEIQISLSSPLQCTDQSSMACRGLEPHLKEKLNPQPPALPQTPHLAQDRNKKPVSSSPCTTRHRPWQWWECRPLYWPGHLRPRCQVRLPRMTGPPESGPCRPAQDLAKVVSKESKATEAHSRVVQTPVARSHPKGSPIVEHTPSTFPPR